MKPAAALARDTIRLREGVLRACLFLQAHGFIIGTWGNISVRVEEGLLITPSRMDYAIQRAEDLVLVSWEGQRIKGERLPSSEAELHRQVLLKRPDLGALVHTHPPYASAVSCAKRGLPVCAEDMAQIIGGEVHCAPYAPGGDHAALAQSVCGAIGETANAVLLQNHGLLVGGRDLQEALVATQVLEKAATMYVLAELLGGCSIIPNQHVAEEHNRFLYKYGTAADFEKKW